MTPLPGQPLTSMSDNSASTQTQTTPISPVSSKQQVENNTKDERINNLNAEVKALKSFIIE